MSNEVVMLRTVGYTLNFAYFIHYAIGIHGCLYKMTYIAYVTWCLRLQDCCWNRSHGSTFRDDSARLSDDIIEVHSPSDTESTGDIWLSNNSTTKTADVLYCSFPVIIQDEARRRCYASLVLVRRFPCHSFKVSGIIHARTWL